MALTLHRLIDAFFCNTEVRDRDVGDLYVCMYVCVCMRVYVCVYVCVYIYGRLHT